MDAIPVTVSVLALAISATTAWLTLFRRGTVKMTQPTVIFFGPDTPRHPSESSLPKVFLRTLLFSTSKRGRVIESMFARLTRDDETAQLFDIWVYGDQKLVRGSGLFVGETGIAANHHFLSPRDGQTTPFLGGQYRLNVYANLLGDRENTLLLSQVLEITPEAAEALKDPSVGVYFDWQSYGSCYRIHIDKKLPMLNPQQLLESLDIK